MLLGDVEITKVMQKLAEAKRYPALARLKLLFYAMVLVSILAVPATVFLVWNRVSEQQKIDAANAGLLSCTPYIFTNKPGSEAEVERKLQQAGPYLSSYIFFLNKVTSLTELKLKDELLLCDPAKSNLPLNRH